MIFWSIHLTKCNDRSLVTRPYGLNIPAGFCPVRFHHFFFVCYVFERLVLPFPQYYQPIVLDSARIHVVLRNSYVLQRFVHYYCRDDIDWPTVDYNWINCARLGFPGSSLTKNLLWLMFLRLYVVFRLLLNYQRQCLQKFCLV